MPGADCASAEGATIPSVGPAPALRKSRRLTLTISNMLIRFSKSRSFAEFILSEVEGLRMTRHGKSHDASFQLARRLADGAADAVVRAAAADVAAHGVVDVGLARPLVLLQERDRAHDLSRLAVAALRHVVRDPRVLHGASLFRRADRLDGRDALLHRGAHRRRARAHRLP